MSGTKKYRQIVDADDRLIGHKWAEEFDPEKDIWRVSALWLRNAKKEVLIAQRSYNKKNSGGLWGPAVAGTLEYDETYEQNIVKEITEEIGLIDLELVKGKKYFFSSDNRNYFGMYFYGLCDKPEKDFVLEDEVAAVTWVSEGWLRKDASRHPEKYITAMVKNLDEIMNDCRE